MIRPGAHLFQNLSLMLQYVKCVGLTPIFFLRALAMRLEISPPAVGYWSPFPRKGVRVIEAWHLGLLWLVLAGRSIKADQE
jgi:hypothetical protein